MKTSTLKFPLTIIALASAMSANATGAPTSGTSAGAGATSNSTSNSTSGSTNDISVTGAPTSAAATVTQAGGTSNMTSSTDTTNKVLSLSFPQPAAPAALPSMRCNSEGLSVGLGWNFVSWASAKSDANKICTLVDASAVAWSRCQWKKATIVYNKAVKLAFKDDTELADAMEQNVDGLVDKPPMTTDEGGNITGRCSNGEWQVPTKVADPRPKPTDPTQPPRMIQRVTLSNGALFKVNSTKLLPGGEALLGELVYRLRGFTELRNIDVGGHASQEGGAKLNMVLSQGRANVVKNRLVAEGFDPTIITATGYGSTQPVAENTTEEGRARNRRVDVVVKGYREEAAK